MMKITQTRLLQIIREELNRIHEAGPDAADGKPEAPMSAGAKFAAKVDKAGTMGQFDTLSAGIDNKDELANHILNTVRNTKSGEKKDISTILGALERAKILVKEKL